MSSFVEIFNYYLSYFSSLITMWTKRAQYTATAKNTHKDKTKANKESDFINLKTLAEYLENETGTQKKTME